MQRMKRILVGLAFFLVFASAGMAEDTPVRIAFEKSVPYRQAVEAFSLPAASAAVTDFGAVPGDDLDDTAALQMALDAGKNAAIFFPAGEYRVSDCLWFDAGQTLVFEEGAVLLRADESCECLLANRREGNGKTAIVGAVLDGNSALNAPLRHLCADHLDGMLLLGCVFRNGNGLHYADLCTVTNAEIIGCVFEDSFRNPTSQYEYVHLAADTEADFAVPGNEERTRDEAACENLLISHCVFKNISKQNSVAIGSRNAAPHRNIRIQQCEFTDWDMAMGAISFPKGTQDAFVSGCRFTRCRSGVIGGKGERLLVSVDNRFEYTNTPVKGKAVWALEDELPEPVSIPLLDQPAEQRGGPVLTGVEQLDDGGVRLIFSEPVRISEAARIFGGGENLPLSDTPGVFVRVTDFGAVPDDRADDSEAIQRAFDAAKDGGIVYFPKGTYMIAKAAAFYSNQSLVFEEGAVLKRHASSPLGHLLLNYFEAGEGGFCACENVNLIGAVFDGNPDVDKSNNMMNLIHTRHVNLINCFFRNGNYWHYIEANSSAGLTITSCVFEDSYTNLQLRSEYLQIDRAGNGSFTTSDKAVYQRLFSDPGPYFDETVCFRVLVNGCVFDSRNSGAVLFGNHSDAAHQYVHAQNCAFLGGNSTRGCVAFAKNMEHFSFANNLFADCTIGLFCNKGTDLVAYADNEFQNIKVPVAGSFTLSEEEGAVVSLAGIIESCSMEQEGEREIILKGIESSDQMWLFGLLDQQGHAAKIIPIR